LKGAEWEEAGTREGPAARGARQGQRRRRKKRGSGWRRRAGSGDAPDADIDRWEATAATRTSAPRNGRGRGRGKGQCSDVWRCSATWFWAHGAGGCGRTPQRGEERRGEMKGGREGRAWGRKAHDVNGPPGHLNAAAVARQSESKKTTARMTNKGATRLPAMAASTHACADAGGSPVTECGNGQMVDRKKKRGMGIAPQHTHVH
jgi:hypothetical protein